MMTVLSQAEFAQFRAGGSPVERLGWCSVPWLKSDRTAAHAGLATLSAEDNPERKNDELDVQQKTLLLDIQKVEAKLLASRQGSRCEDLREPCQARRHLMPGFVAGNAFKCDDLIWTSYLDFFCKKRTRPDETHFPFQNVPQLRQFVHTCRPEDTPDCGDALVVAGRLTVRKLSVRVESHRPEFP